MRPVIALLSDFGARDHYAGTMKGVVLGICPDVTLVDITHEITPHDVLEGALQLGAAWRYFPAGTIFLAVVDPGVGSSRRGIAAEAGGTPGRPSAARSRGAIASPRPPPGWPRAFNSPRSDVRSPTTNSSTFPMWTWTMRGSRA
jgi:hypothetical protein